LGVRGRRVRYLHGGYQAAGRGGPPLLLVHGLLGYSFSWRRNLKAFARQTGVYAVDLPGTGYSERVADLDCSLRGRARHLLGMLDELGLEKSDVLGSSYGGAVAMMLSTLAPQRVRRLVLAAPVHPWSEGQRLTIRIFRRPLAAMLARRGARLLAPLNGYFVRRQYGDPRRMPPGTIAGYAAPLRIPGTVEHTLKIVRCWDTDMGELERELPKISQIPLLLIWGSRDRVVSPSSASRLQRAFRNCELSFLQGAGHLPYEELPEEFNRAVLDFLAKTSSQ